MFVPLPVERSQIGLFLYVELVLLEFVAFDLIEQDSDQARERVILLFGTDIQQRIQVNDFLFQVGIISWPCEDWRNVTPVFGDGGVSMVP